MHRIVACGILASFALVLACGFTAEARAAISDHIVILNPAGAVVVDVFLDEATGEGFGPFPLGPIVAAPGAVLLYEPGTGFTELSDQIWVDNNNNLFFTSDPNPSLGTDIPILARIEETGELQSVSQYFSFLGGPNFPPNFILVASDVESPVPEPASVIVWSLLALTITGGSWWRRRKATA